MRLTPATFAAASMAGLMLLSFAGGVPQAEEKEGGTDSAGPRYFFLVREEILPEAIKKTIRVKEMLKRGDARTINEAVERMELSRSAYYKYKDYVFPFYEASKNKIVTLTFLLEHKKGEDVEMFAAQLYDLAVISNRPLSAEAMTKFVARSNEIMQKLAK